MAIRAELTGNLTKNPVMKPVTVDGETRRICEMRVFSDVGKKVGGEWVQDDDKSTGVDVTIWNENLAQHVINHFRKGARVLVIGDLYLNEYQDADDAHHAGLRMNAESVGLQPYRLEQVVFRQREPAEAG